MKKLILSTAVLALAFSCNNPSSTTPPNSNDNSQQEKNMANNRKIYTAIETGDTSPIDTLIADDAIDHDGRSNGIDLKGKDSILQMLGDLHNNFKNMKVEVISTAANGNYIFTLLHVTGTKANSSMGMPDSDIDGKGVDVVKLNSDNKISEHWGFTEDQDVSKEMMEMHNKMQEKPKMKK